MKQLESEIFFKNKISRKMSAAFCKQILFRKKSHQDFKKVSCKIIKSKSLKMKKSKKVILPALLLGTIAITGVGVSSASADETENPRTSIIQRIAEKFNLNEDEVKTVFEEHKAERQEEMKQKHEEHLNKLVSEGKLTEDQKNALIAKREEMREKYGKGTDEWKNKTPEEKREMMEQHREEMEKWAEENGIDLKDLRPEGKRFGNKRPGHGPRF